MQHLRTGECREGRTSEKHAADARRSRRASLCHDLSRRNSRSYPSASSTPPWRLSIIVHANVYARLPRCIGFSYRQVWSYPRNEHTCFSIYIYAKIPVHLGAKLKSPSRERFINDGRCEAPEISTHKPRCLGQVRRLSVKAISPTVPSFYAQLSFIYSNIPAGKPRRSFLLEYFMQKVENGDLWSRGRFPGIH